MVSTLVFSITTAGLLFLMLGERLGVPAPVGVIALQALLALACGLMILLSATNRLDPFLSERPSAQAFGRVARLGLLLFAGLAAHAGFALEAPEQVGFILAGYAAGTLLLLPREPGFHSEGAPVLHAGGVARRVAIAGAALVLFSLWFPPVIADATLLSRLNGDLVRAVLVIALALGVAIGGAAGLSRLARAILLLGLVFAVLPLAGAAFLERHLPLENLERAFAQAVQALPAALSPKVGLNNLPAFLTGFAIGGLGSALRPPREGAARTLVLASLALGVALAGVLLVMTEVVRLHALVLQQIADQPPARWPIFVFDEAILGWLKVCGEAPRDVLDAFRACRLRGFAGFVPASEIRLEPFLLGPAIAASRGLPVVLGAGWMMAAPLAALVALGLLLHGAATLMSETYLYRRRGKKALRSTRLLLARVLVVAAIPVLLLLRGGPVVEAPFALWVLLGSAMLVGAAWLADLVRSLARIRRARMSDDALPLNPNAEAT